MKRPLVIIGGPTACGKTAMSILLAKKIGGEIISADSMQVYRYMDIGTAKVTLEEAEGIPHYLIDELDPDEPYHVMIFQKKAKAYMQQIWERGNIPIVVGGTGFYINALLYDNTFTETDLGDSTTSPAAILLIVFWSRSCIFCKCIPPFRYSPFALFCKSNSFCNASIGVIAITSNAFNSSVNSVSPMVNIST